MANRYCTPSRRARRHQPIPSYVYDDENDDRPPPRPRFDIPALLVLLAFAAVCFGILYRTYDIPAIIMTRLAVPAPAPTIRAVSPVAPAQAPAVQPAAPAVPDTNDPAVVAPDDYQEHSKPNQRMPPSIQQQPVVQSAPAAEAPPVPVPSQAAPEPAVAPLDEGTHVAPPAPPEASEAPETTQSDAVVAAPVEQTKPNTRKAPGAK